MNEAIEKYSKKYIKDICGRLDEIMATVDAILHSPDKATDEELQHIALVLPTALYFPCNCSRTNGD